MARARIWTPRGEGRPHRGRAKNFAQDFPESAKRRCSVTLGRAPHATRRAANGARHLRREREQVGELNKARESMWKLLIPLLYAPTLPLIRIGLRHNRTSG